MKRAAAGALGALFLIMLSSCEQCSGDNGGQATGQDANTVNDASPDGHAAQDGAEASDGAQELVVVADISKRLKQFAPVEITVDDALIADELRPVLKKLILAAKVMDEIYLSQISADNVALRARLAADPAHADALAYFDVMYGPWDRLADSEPFVGTAKRPPGVTYYPQDLTKQAFEDFVKAHPDQSDSLRGYFSVIEHQGDDLVAVPYSKAYQKQLTSAALLLEEGAEVATDERLASYMRLRAKAFLSDDYFASDVAWMQLGDCPIEVVIGPYEVYEDELMGLKAAFEAFVTIRDPEASEQLARVSALSDQLERALPIAEEHRNFERGDARPISVVYELYAAGDTRAGVQTLAFNLPNDERVREEHGYKLVLLRNVMEAKYNMILVPIAQRLLAEDQQANLSFDAFLNNTLMHESAHGLGPGNITVDGEQTTVNQRLSDLYSTIEEAKADVVGLFASQWMIQNGHLDRAMERQLYATFLGGFFRSVRFGAGEAHGQANMIQFNYLMANGALTLDEGRYRVNYERIGEVITNLARELLTIEATGDHERAQQLVAQYGTLGDDLRQALTRLEGIPVDIRPSFPTADALSQ